jgi:TP901 family phage tail tape measure protein
MSIERLQIIVDALFKGKGELDRANQSVKDLDKSAGGARKSTDKMTGSMGMLGTALKGAAIGALVTAGYKMVEFGKQSIDAAANFQAGMSRVSAVSGATGDDLKALQDTAKQLGATTRFSAQEAADGMSFLAMAGFQVNDIVGAMPGVLQLAAAANLDLGRSADIVSNILTGYGKKVEDLAHINDVLVKAFTSANVDLNQLGEAMKYAGPVASGMGVQFEEAAAAIALMGNAGIQGSMAGTSLRGALTRLANPTREVRDTLGRLGVTTHNTRGELLSLEDIVRQLEKSGADTSDMMLLFGQRAGPAMATLVDQGADALRDFTQSLNDAGGTAERVASVQMDNLLGKKTELKSATEGLKITIGDLLMPTIMRATERQLEWVRAIDENIVKLNYLTDAYRQQTRETNQEIMEQADGLDALIRSGQGLTEVYNEMSWAERLIGQSMTRSATEDLARNIALATTSAEEYAAAIAQAFAGETLWEYQAALRALGMTEEQFYDAARAARDYARAVDEAAQADSILTRQHVQTTERVDYLAQTYRSGIFEVEAYESSSRTLESTMRRARRETEEKRIATEAAAEADAIAAERTERLAAGMSATFMAALRANEGIGLYIDVLDAAKKPTGELELSTHRVGLEFMSMAEQGGLSMEQIALLGGAYGVYTDEALDAAIRTALITTKMKELVEKVGAGELSVYDLRRELDNYIATLDKIPDAIQTTVRVDYAAGATPLNVPGLPQGFEMFSRGGRVGGGMAGRDSVPALLTPGEIVLPVNATTSMDAAMDFLNRYMPGQTTMSSSVNIQPGAIVINQQPGQDSQMIADTVLDAINDRLGRQADQRARF